MLYFRHPLIGDKLIIEKTKISKYGFCQQCGSVLERQPHITDEEFAELRQEFMNKAIISHGNIFLQSSPEELLLFQQFLENRQSRPVTVVFDGLNIAGCTGGLKSTAIRSGLVSEFFSIIYAIGI